MTVNTDRCTDREHRIRSAQNVHGRAHRISTDREHRIRSDALRSGALTVNTEYGIRSGALTVNTEYGTA